MRILIADDSATIRMALCGVLSGLGHQIEEAATGRQALDGLLAPDGPRLAILDWMMPEMDGPEVCQRVRQATLDIQPFLILLTVKDSKEDIIQALGKGANDYLSKPFHEGELRARLAVGQWVIDLQTSLADRVRALEEAAAHIRTLQGILPICMYCHKIRDDRESWTQIERYITEHTDVRLSHGICPDCLTKAYAR